MKLIEKDSYTSRALKVRSVSDAVDDQLNRRTAYADNTIEEAVYVTEEARKYLCCLTRLLHDKGVLTDADILELLPDFKEWEDDNAL